MTSRERVRAVLRGEKPDKIPNGLGGSETESVHVLTYKKMQEMLGLENKPPRILSFMSNAVFEMDMINAVKGDIILLAAPRLCSAPLWSEERLPHWKAQRLWEEDFLVPKNESFSQGLNGEIFWENTNTVCPPGAYYFDSKDKTDLYGSFKIPDIRDFDPQNSFSDDFLRSLEETAKKLYDETQLSISLGECITDLQIQPGGFVGAMVLMLEQPDLFREILNKHADAALCQIELLNQAVGKYVDMMQIAHDFGDNRCVTIGAELWRKIYKPAYKKLFTGWKKRTDIAVNLHSCGAVGEILEDLTECGVQVINPVQTSAAGMQAAELKKRYKGRIVFYGGGYDAQSFKQTDTYEDVYEAVKANIKMLGDGGGYIFSGVHNLPPNLPKHHLKAIMDAAKDNL